MSLLDGDTYNGIEISENYAALVEKWGEWIAFGGEGGLTVKFIDIRAAFFSGLAVVFLSLMAICFLLAIIAGKILLPQLSKLYADRNEYMVDVATLQTQAEVSELKKKKETGRF